MGEEMRQTTWTAENVETLKALWEQGVSHGQIAHRLGYSRSAVIGKVHRLDLPLRSTTSRHKAGRPRKRPSQVRKSGPVLCRPPAIPSFPLPSERPRPGAPDPLMLGVLDLTASSCRYPIGDPRHADFGFCGHERIAGLPYCDHHVRVCFPSVESRAALRRAA